MIVLTGFMGTGKTTTGRELAALLKYDFVDTDALIEQRHGPIPDIFAEHGEERFREIEAEIATEVANMANTTVVATGGRFMLDPNNQASLANADVFCLSATVDTILARVVADGVADGRPLLAGPGVADRVTNLLAERAAAYGAFQQVTTDDRSPQQIATEIVAMLNARDYG